MKYAWLTVLLLAGTLGLASAAGIQDALRTRDLKGTRQALADNPALAKTSAKGGFTLLHWAARYDFADGALALIDNGADVNARTERGTTPLHMAAAMKATSVAAFWVTLYCRSVRLALIDSGEGSG